MLIYLGILFLCIIAFSMMPKIRRKRPYGRYGQKRIHLRDKDNSQ